MATTIKVVDVGLGLITAALVASTSKYLGWGTGTNAAAHGDTALQTPANTARVAGTQSQQQTTVANDTYQVSGTMTNGTGAALAVTEAAVFDGAGSGGPPTGANLYARAAFAAVNLDPNDSILFIWKTSFVSG